MTVADTVRALDEDTVFSHLRDAVVVVCEVDPASLAPSTRLVDDLAADSLALVEIIDITESSLAPLARPGFSFDDAVIDQLPTLKDVVAHALDRDRAGAVPSRQPVQRR